MARHRANDYEHKQRAILDTAAKVISESGIDKSSMSRIARDGDFSKALLYHYYPSKDALIFDLVHVHLTELDRELALVDLEELAPEVRLHNLVDRTLSFYKEQQHYHKVQLNIAGVLPADKMDSVRIIERRIVKRFSDVLGNISPALKENHNQLMPVTMSLFGMLNWAYTWFREDGAVNRQEYGALVTRLLLTGIQGSSQSIKR